MFAKAKDIWHGESEEEKNREVGNCHCCAKHPVGLEDAGITNPNLLIQVTPSAPSWNNKALSPFSHFFQLFISFCGVHA